jgi:predicted dehydrogenase
MLNAAIIGCGEMGKIHSDCIAKLDDIRNMAFCDLELERATSLKNQFQADFATQNTDAIFRNPDIDVVYITSVTGSHLQLCLTGLQTEKHLFIEKPLAVNIADALNIYKAAQKSDRVIMVGMKFRFYSILKKVRHLIKNPFMISVQIMDDPWPENFWANDPIMGGGNVISQGVHGSDLLRFMVGSEPKQVFASGANYHQKTGVIDNLAATYTFENGVAGNLIIGDTGQQPLLSKFCMQIFGAEGSLILTERLTRAEFHPTNSNDIIEFQGAEDGFMEENRAFVKSIIKGAPLQASTHDGYTAQAMIAAAIRSLKTRNAEFIHQ